MLDLARLESIRLHRAPRFQRFVAVTFLMPNYHLPPRTRVVFEGQDRVPDEPVIFAMNHTDRFNYWPFQLMWWRRHGRFTATWVKGKYYENPMVGRFMEATNNIPTVSRGYLITRDFIATMDRRPTDEEYAALRALVNDAGHRSTSDAAGRAAEAKLPAGLEKLTGLSRKILGRPFDPSRETYAQAMDALFRAMMERFVRLNREAADLGLDLLIFPQGTRSIRLSKGHIGLAQMAMALGRTVVPVGCNGSDRVYPGSSPVAKPGRVVYRFGDPIRPGADPDWVTEPFEPFTSEAEAAHGPRFQGYVDRLMGRIDGLLDPEYRFGEEPEGTGVRGSDRFV